jgi:hypothetical protein
LSRANPHAWRCAGCAALLLGSTALPQPYHRLPTNLRRTPSSSIPQETLNALRKAMENTKIMCAVMLDTKVGL